MATINYMGIEYTFEWFAKHLCRELERNREAFDRKFKAVKKCCDAGDWTDEEQKFFRRLIYELGDAGACLDSWQAQFSSASVRRWHDRSRAGRGIEINPYD